MKKTLLALFLLVFTMSAEAQTIIRGALPSLTGEVKINFVIDCSRWTIDNKQESDWLEFRQATQPEYDAHKELENELKPALASAFADNVNTRIGKSGAYLAITKDAHYTLTLIPLTVSRKGDNTNECTITDQQGRELVCFTVEGSGGVFGTMANLWGDGYKSTGKKVGKLLTRCFK